MPERDSTCAGRGMTEVVIVAVAVPVPVPASVSACGRWHAPRNIINAALAAMTLMFFGFIGALVSSVFRAAPSAVSKQAGPE